MDKGYINFISFARGIQNGFNPNNCPLLDDAEAEKEYTSAFSRFSFSLDVEKDILNQFYRGEIDLWDAIEQLEDECNLSYDEACKKVKSASSGNNNALFSGLNSLLIKDSDAYWISLSGKILSVEVSHVSTICDFPEAFGFTKDQVRSFYESYNEPFGSEGEARDVLIELAVKRGWIRIRYNPTEDFYHIELSNLDGRHKDFIWEWARALMKVNHNKLHSGVLIYDFANNSSLTGSMEDLVSFQLFNSVGMGGHFLLPIFDVYDFLNLRPNIEAVHSVKKRKRSKYHGALVNNTFEDASGGVPSASAPMSSSIKTHPSLRYLVINHMVHYSRRHLVKSSLSGTLDTFLLQNYCAGLGTDEYGTNIKHTGDNGRVELHFNTDSGCSTYVDLGGSLDTGYVVAQITDELGLFPEGTEVGDLIDNAVIQEIIRSQGERDSESITSSVHSALDKVVAFWISPTGDVISTHGSHTSTVLDNPERFGLSEKKASSLFMHGEEEAIIAYLLHESWIRVREQFNSVFISVQGLSLTIQKNLQDWALGLSKDGATPVILDVSNIDTSYTVFLDDIRNGTFSGSRFSLDGQVKDEYALWSVLGRSQGKRGQGSITSSIFSNVSPILNVDIVDASFNFALSVREFNRLFSQYIQFLQGNVFEAFDRDSTREPVRAKECLEDMTKCLYRVTNDYLILQRCLVGGKSYSEDELKEANSNIIDLVGTWEQVEARFHSLSDPDPILVKVFTGFKKTLTEFGFSVDSYNRSVQGGELLTVRQALGVIKTRVSNLEERWVNEGN